MLTPCFSAGGAHVNPIKNSRCGRRVPISYRLSPWAHFSHPHPRLLSALLCTIYCDFSQHLSINSIPSFSVARYHNSALASFSRHIHRLLSFSAYAPRTATLIRLLGPREQEPVTQRARTHCQLEYTESDTALLSSTAHLDHCVPVSLSAKV